MTEPASKQNIVAQPATAWKLAWVHLLPWLVLLVFGLLVAGASISGLLWNPQSLAVWVLGWAVASAAWLGLSKVWKQSWPLAGYGVVTSFAALALFWAQPGFASLALFLWLTAGAMLLWGCADQPRLQALGVGLALVNAAAALLMAAVLAWPQSQAPAELIQAAAAVIALACHAALAAVALQQQKNSAQHSILKLEQQCEALTQVCIQVFGNQSAITFAGSQGHFELNVYNPVMAYNFLQSVRLLADGMGSFNEHCATGIEPNRERIAQLLNESLMLVTALSPVIGYQQAAKIAEKAAAEGLTLKQAALALGAVTEEQFDSIVRPETMIGKGLAGA